MYSETNIFGTGTLYTPHNLGKKIYATCTACMSIYSEFLSWANASRNIFRFVREPDQAEDIIVLSCQVTDLAVLNDLRTIENLMNLHPGKRYFIGGCLAQRFDILLPEGVLRLDNVCQDYQPIHSSWMVNYAKPFWVPDFKENDRPLSDGHLFRRMYPLRIGVGCKGRCKYCTIRHTRGAPRVLEPSTNEFINEYDVVLIADSPTADQIKEWCSIAKHNLRRISVRNIEPQIALECHTELTDLARAGLLKIFHSPVQHTDALALADMFRSSTSAALLWDLAKMLRKESGVVTATNVITDYKSFPNPDMAYLREAFDYVSWNPYWDGKWDRAQAEKRFEHYFDKKDDEPNGPM